MPPSQPHNRSEKNCEKNDGSSNFLLTKEGLKGIGVNSNLKKRSVSGFVAMEQVKLNGLMEEALQVGRNTGSDAGKGERIVEKNVGMLGKSSRGGVGVTVDKDGCRFVGMDGHESYDGSVLTIRKDFSDLLVDVSAGCDNAGVANQKEIMNEVRPSRIAAGEIGSVTEVQENGGYSNAVGSKKDNNASPWNLNWVSPGERPNQVSREGSTEGQAKKWNDVVRPKQQITRMKFEYFAPTKTEGKTIISPPLSVDLKGRAAWEFCLVGYFFEKRVAFHVMQFHANKKWKNRGLKDVIMNDDGFFFIRFQSEEDMLGVLEEESCLVEGKPLILQRWHPKLILSKEVPKTIPLWVKIYNIPLQYWHKEGLGHICSGVGKPLGADMLTEQMCREASGRLSFAKMLVEVDAKSPLPEELLLRVPNEDFLEPMEVKMRVVYPWKPSWCPTCNSFGHSLARCPKMECNQDKVEIVRGQGKIVIPEESEEGFQVVHKKGKERVGVRQNGGIGTSEWVGRKYAEQGRRRGNQYGLTSYSRGDLGKKETARGMNGGPVRSAVRSGVDGNKFKGLEDIGEEDVDEIVREIAVREKSKKRVEEGKMSSHQKEKMDIEGSSIYQCNSEAEGSKRGGGNPTEMVPREGDCLLNEEDIIEDRDEETAHFMVMGILDEENDVQSKEGDLEPSKESEEVSRDGVRRGREMGRRKEGGYSYIPK